MIIVADVTAEAPGSSPVAVSRRNFGCPDERYAELFGDKALLALECTANSDTLHHNLRATVTTALSTAIPLLVSER